MTAHLEQYSPQFYASARQPTHPIYLIVTPLSPTIVHSRKSSRVPMIKPLGACKQELGDNPNALPVIFGGILEEVSYPLARRLFRGWMIGEIARS